MRFAFTAGTDIYGSSEVQMTKVAPAAPTRPVVEGLSLSVCDVIAHYGAIRSMTFNDATDDVRISAASLPAPPSPFLRPC